MRNLILKISAAAVLISLPLDMAYPIPYSIWKIQKKIYKGDYVQAGRELDEISDNLKGDELLWGRLLEARLETDCGKASGIYLDIIGSGTEVSYIARLELARVLYASEDYRGAASILNKIPASEESKVRLESLFFRGLSHKMLGEVYRAREDLKMIDRGKFLYPAYMELAELSMQTGNYTDAIEKYEAIGGIHSNPAAIYKLGVCYEITGEYNKAFDAYKSLRNNYPYSLEAPKASGRISSLLSERRDREERKVEPEKQDHGGKGELYTLQFGAFREKVNAEKLFSELSGIFPNARIEDTLTDSGTEIFRVRSGKYSRRDLAERDSIEAIRQYGYKCRILTIH